MFFKDPNIFYLALAERFADFLVNLSAAFFFTSIITFFIDVNLGHFSAYFTCFLVCSIAVVAAGAHAKELKQLYIDEGTLK